MLTGLAGSRTSNTQVCLTWSAQLSAIPSSATTSRSRAGRGRAVWVPPPNGGDQFPGDHRGGGGGAARAGAGGVGPVGDGGPAAAPGAVGQALGDDRVVEGVAAVGRPVRPLAPG